MVYGIVFLVIGVLMFFSTLLADPPSLSQQAIQDLRYIWSSVFMVGGMLTIAILGRIKSYKDHQHNSTDTGTSD